MNRFVRKVSVFISLLVLLLLAIAATWIIYNFKIIERPAGNFSTSYSFNEKMKFLGKGKKTAEILGLGSSMTLNNLHSKAIASYFSTEEFVNTASWGLNMQDDFHLLKIFYKRYKPQKVIIVSNLPDFKKSDKKIEFGFCDNYLNDKNLLKTGYYYIKTFNIDYLMANSKYAKKVRHHSDDYDYLGFDRYGGVNFTNSDFIINQPRWMGDSISKKDYLDAGQYQFLDSIASFCNKKNIQLLFFQTPIRKGYINNLSEKEHEILNRHYLSVNQILNKHAFKLVNSNDIVWPDSLFVDWIHLKDEGAKKFTEYCLGK